MHGAPDSETVSTLDDARPLAPASFKPHAFTKSTTVKQPIEAVWAWLNDPATFTAQIPPYRVEFVEGSGFGGTSGFAPGVRNVHHGPLLCVAGEIGEVRAPHYRDLRYDYGSHVISMRLVRPTRLQFWLEEGEPGRTTIRVQLDALVKPWFRGLWSTGQGLFWKSFHMWARRGSRKHARRLQGAAGSSIPQNETNTES